MTRYFYAGYDILHTESGLKNFYVGTKKEITGYLRSVIEFKEGTSKDEIEEYLNLMFKTYTTKCL